MHQAETPADDARVVAQLADFLGARVGDDVEVLGLAPEHEIAHAAADEEAGVAGIAQAMQDLEGVFTDQRAGNGMLRAREDGGLANLGFTLSAVAAGSPVVKIAFARIIPLPFCRRTRFRSLRLAAQDVALSRRKQGFESPRERHTFRPRRCSVTSRERRFRRRARNSPNNRSTTPWPTRRTSPTSPNATSTPR